MKHHINIFKLSLSNLRLCDELISVNQYAENEDSPKESGNDDQQ